MHTHQDITQQAEVAAALIAEADSLIIAAGAGMGVDSGLPDFRGTEGFWQAYPALAQARLRFEEIASPHAFARDPQLAWGFYGHRLALYRNTVPHEGFHILQRWTTRMPRGAFVFTSNVDGQFQRAGFSGARVLECHGSIHHLQCSAPCSDALWPADAFLPDVDATACQLRSPLPRCPHCGAMARPNVLMFGDADWVEARTAEQHRRYRAWRAAVSAPVVIELGAGTHIATVRYFSESQDAPLLRINPTEARVGDGRGIGMACGALAGLQAIDGALGTL
ncbi:SIR2 family NAD-dependent protein deacylase [Uliginosibacterium sp. H1]|uniref:SIR2 family NAD-dependent protein deacylase n=1 Tax=Uliginosibacterium sp. H1 TaxID=3114757 RepID=UPI002E18F2AA|nr:Sir2 family NAD-dependent protein deacetylase [Uliginosibacterium sp. H1]